MSIDPRLLIAASTIIAAVLIWLALVVLLRFRGRKSLVYLGFFTVFFIYMFKVLDVTVIQYQSLIVLKLLMPNLIMNGQAAGDSVNLVPLVTLGPGDLEGSLLNILMLVPFGFGLPFITNLRIGGVVLAGALSSIAIELLQLVTGLMANITFRVADINDVIFNTMGAPIGYVLFVAFTRFYRRLSRDRAIGLNPVSRHIVERPQLRAVSSSP